MAQRVSRRKIAAYAADSLVAGQKTSKVLETVAAYLIANKRTREQELIVRDIEAALQARGIVVADITSAHPVADSLLVEIKKLTGATSLQTRTIIDGTVLGGIRIDTPGKRFDGTIRRKLNALKAQQL